MEPYYNVIEINDKKALKRTLFSIGSNHSYVYRGQEDSNWTLKPSLERNIEFFNLENTRIRDYENNVIQKTESDCPNLNPIERIAKVQHYGGATRLIDFTREYAHALFFAFYNYPESDYASVWIISTENLPYIDRYILEEREGDLSLFEIDFQRNLEREKVFHFFIDEFQYSEEVNLDKFLENKMENYPGEMKQYKIAALDLIRNKQNEYEFNYQNNSGIKFFKPGEENPRDREVNEKLEEYFEKNFRLFKQKGLFLFSSDIGNSFEENLFFGKTMKELEREIKPIQNPDTIQLESILNEASRSQRGIVKINIKSDLTKFVLKLLKNGKYELEQIDTWEGEGALINTYEIQPNGTPITYKEIFPDIYGYFRNFIYSLFS